MATQRSSSDLFYRVAFDERGRVDRGDGVYVDRWQEKLSVRAGYIHLRGGETVQAARLAGQHTQVIFVRASEQTKEIKTDWPARDVRTGQTFNIREVVLTEDRKWIDLTCQSGVNTG